MTLTTGLEPTAVAASASPPRDQGYVMLASACAALAGVIHAAVAPHHLAESLVIGTLFLLVAFGQLVLAGLLRRTRAPALLLPAIGVNLGIIALYVASRTADLPFLPVHDAGHSVSHLPVAGGVGNGIPVYPGSRIEDVGVTDLLCLDAELVLVVVLAGLLPGRARRVATTTMLALGVSALAARAIGVLG